MTNSIENTTPLTSPDAGWEFACMVIDLPEDTLVEIEVRGIIVLMLRHKGEVVAFPPSCPHMEEPLKNGLFDNDECVITCTKHLWQWDARNGAPIGLAECPLLKYEVRTNGDRVFLNVQKQLTYEFG